LNEPQPVTEEVHLRDYWRVLKKHRSLVLAVFLCTVLATALFVLTTTPIYTAATTLLIERKAPQAIDIQGALSEAQTPDEYDYYRTQYEILKSRGLATRVIQEENLESNPLFSGERTQKGLIAGLWNRATAWLGAFFSSESPPECDGVGVDPRSIDAYLGKMLEVKPVPRTRLVKVAFSTPDPELSAQVVNSHVKAYIRQGVELRAQANEEAQGFLEEKLVELKERVEKSEAALNNYRRDKGILSLDDKENIVVDRLTDLNKRLTEAEAERISLEAKVFLIRQKDYDALPDVVSNTLIQTLKGQQTVLEGEYAQLTSQFKADYPRVAQLKAQLGETQRRLNKEIQKVVASIQSAYLAAKANEEGLREKMEQQKTATLSLKDASVNYAILAREVDTNRQLYDSVLQRMKEMGVAAEVRTSNVSIIDPAEPPLYPSRPRKLLSLLLSAVVGLLAGVGMAFFLEYLDNSLKSPEDVERQLGLPNLAVVPDFLTVEHHDASGKTLLDGIKDRALLNGRKGKNSLNGRNEVTRRIAGKASRNQFHNNGSEFVLYHHPLSVINEAYRMLRTAILLSRAGETPRTLLFTSATEGEGKTATTVNTAVTFTQMGLRVLVVDADLRRPRCHQILRVYNETGLTELLAGQGEVRDVIRATTTENLFFISSGTLPPNPAELVGSRKMYEVLLALREEYDCIFIDSPPVMPVSDALMLSTLVDGVVLVIDGQKTPRNVVKGAQARLAQARAKILGVVLNRINMQRGDYSYYYNQYSSYYRHTDIET
jgi:capsular exopolysaccharide synthesis family protein